MQILRGKSLLEGFRERLVTNKYIWPNKNVETLLLVTKIGQFDISLGTKSSYEVMINYNKFHRIVVSAQVKHFILIHNHPFVHAPSPSLADLEFEKWMAELGYRYYSGSYIVVFNNNINWNPIFKRF